MVSRGKPDRGVSPDRPDWLPDTEASRSASYRITPPEILARYGWRAGDCFACRAQNRFVTVIGYRGGETDSVVPLTMCGSCVLVQEERRRARMVRRGRPYVPGGIGQRERREE